MATLYMIKNIGKCIQYCYFPQDIKWTQELDVVRIVEEKTLKVKEEKVALWCHCTLFLHVWNDAGQHFRKTLDLAVHINSMCGKHVQTCAVRISAILMIGHDCIIHQTRLASGKTLYPAAFQVVFCL